MSGVNEFITNYTPALDRLRIAFAWNGQHADVFRDANNEFRSAVLEAALAHLGAVPIELVRDLYDAETAWAAEAWCVNTHAVRALAEELLTRGGPEFVEDFLTGKLGRGMDAHCAAYFECPRELAERLLAEVERRLVSAAGPRRTLLESGREIFQWWVGNAR